MTLFPYTTLFRSFYEFLPNFMNYSRIFSRTFIFLLSCRTEISDPDNSEPFPNYTRIIHESRIFNLAELNPNNSFVTMVLPPSSWSQSSTSNGACDQGWYNPLHVQRGFSNTGKFLQGVPAPHWCRLKGISGAVPVLVKIKGEQRFWLSVCT